MGNLLKLFIEKGKTIEQLQAKIGELEDRLLQQEKYTSKDCLIFENLPEKFKPPRSYRKIHLFWGEG